MDGLLMQRPYLWISGHREGIEYFLFDIEFRLQPKPSEPVDLMAPAVE